MGVIRGADQNRPRNKNCPLTHLRDAHRIAHNMLSAVRFYFAYYFNGLRSVAAGCA